MSALSILGLAASWAYAMAHSEQPFPFKTPVTLTIHLEYGLLSSLLALLKATGAAILAALVMLHRILAVVLTWWSRAPLYALTYVVVSIWLYTDD